MATATQADEGLDKDTNRVTRAHKSQGHRDSPKFGLKKSEKLGDKDIWTPFIKPNSHRLSMTIIFHFCIIPLPVRL